MIGVGAPEMEKNVEKGEGVFFAGASRVFVWIVLRTCAVG